MNKSMKISGLLLALLMTWGGAQAAGLGKLTVQSALGQPLRAEIELLSVSKDEVADLSARLASAEAYRQARIDRQEALARLNFSVEQRASGQPFIRITSTTPVADPYLEMLIELNWSSGRLIREYTVLLDPPERKKPPEPTSRPLTPAAGDAAAPAPVATRPRPAQTSEDAGPRRYGPVKQGETLRGIATRLKPSDVTLEQMLVGLYQANPNAFQGNNMNRLNRGQVLDVPDRSALVATSQGDAVRAIRGHVAEWQAYRRKVAEMAGESVPSAVPERDTGRITPRAEAPAISKAPQDVLQLSKGEPGLGGQPDAKLRQKVQSLEEELAAKARALGEAKERVDQLERTVQDMQKLLEMRAQEPVMAPPVAPPVEVAPPVAAPVAPVAPAVAEAVPAPLPKPESGGGWLSTFIGNPLYIGGLIAALLLSALLWMMMVGSRRRQGLTKFEDSIMTGGEFKNNAVFAAPQPGAASGASTEGSMLLTDFSRLGMGAIDSHEVDPIAEAEVYMAYGRDAQAEEILKEALGKDPGRHEISLKLLEIYASRKDTLAFETAASELYASLAGQNTPVWQRAAEMGRSIDPDNPLYRVAVTDMPKAAPVAAAAAGAAMMADAGLAAEPDASADTRGLEASGESEGGLEFTLPDASFEPAVEPLTPSAPDLDEVAGLSLDANEFSLPDETILPEAPAASSVSDLDEGLEFAPSQPLETPEDRFAEPVAEIEPASETFTETELLEFDLDEKVPPSEDMPVLDLSGIDLELDTGTEEPEAANIAIDDVPASAASVPEFDLAEETGLPSAFEAPVEDITPMAETPLEASEFEPAASDAPEVPLEEDLAFNPDLREEVNTKLDLARAYLEMGDSEGAREILQEVLNEGDAGQKAEAEKLLGDHA